MTKQCTWPSCLTEDQQDALADEVLRQMAGAEPTPPGPDQRHMCRCGTGTPGLREQYADAIDAVTGGTCPGDILDAVMAVRDRELERMKIMVAASSEPGQAVRMAAQYADRAIENGERAERAEALLRRYVQLADVSHAYRIMGGHDSIGENFTCAGCALRDEIRTMLDQSQEARS
jgi:hypothetical protein